MSERSDVVVIGAGVGGLAAAIRLAAAGRHVTVLERNDAVGGKLAVWRVAGYTFDLGPSLLTLPHVFDELLATAGTSLAAEVELVRLDPQFAYHWPDGSQLIVADDRAATAAGFDELAPGAGDAWRRFDARGQRIWDVSERTFLAGPLPTPLGLIRRMRTPSDVLAIDPLRTLHRAARRDFADPRLVQWAGRYATYSGSSPYRAPATLACIPAIESRFGCWYVRGGMGVLATALAATARRLGVDIRTHAEVRAIVAHGERVAGVELVDGGRIEAPVVVADVDAEHLYTDLLPDADALARLRRVPRSTSAMVLAAGVRGLTPDVHHHNVWFAADARAEFAALEAGRLADDATIYGCVSAVTDPSQAPGGCENWFVLVNAPVGAELDAAAHQARLLDELARRGVDLRDRVEVIGTLTPVDIARRSRAPGGAIYGAASDGWRAAFLRPGNAGPRAGLYLVGGSSHPGGGLPLVVIGARIAADLILTGAS